MVSDIFEPQLEIIILKTSVLWISNDKYMDMTWKTRYVTGAPKIISQVVFQESQSHTLADGQMRAHSLVQALECVWPR